MPVRLINPNTTASLTEAMVAGARAPAPELTIDGVTATRGVPTIDGFGDDVYGAAAVLEILAAHDDADVRIIDCFGDPGLLAAREQIAKPVIGISEAAMLTAMAPRGLARPRGRRLPWLRRDGRPARAAPAAPGRYP
jgi:allantoin racemase